MDNFADICSDAQVVAIFECNAIFFGLLGFKPKELFIFTSKGLRISTDRMAFNIPMGHVKEVHVDFSSSSNSIICIVLTAQYATHIEKEITSDKMNFTSNRITMICEKLLGNTKNVLRVLFPCIYDIEVDKAKHILRTLRRAINSTNYHTLSDPTIYALSKRESPSSPLPNVNAEVVDEPFVNDTNEFDNNLSTSSSNTTALSSESVECIDLTRSPNLSSKKYHPVVDTPTSLTSTKAESLTDFDVLSNSILDAEQTTDFTTLTVVDSPISLKSTNGENLNDLDAVNNLTPDAEQTTDFTTKTVFDSPTSLKSTNGDNLNDLDAVDYITPDGEQMTDFTTQTVVDSPTSLKPKNGDNLTDLDAVDYITPDAEQMNDFTTEKVVDSRTSFKSTKGDTLTDLDALNNLISDAEETFDITKSTVDDDNRTILLYQHDEGAIQLNIGDYKCLASEEYLNDKIIDFYMKYIQNCVIQTNQDRRRTHIFSSYFYHVLTFKNGIKKKTDDVRSEAQRRHERVMNWTKNVNIFEKDFIIIPINERAHWCLVIICFVNMLLPVDCDNYATKNDGQQCNGDETIKQPVILIFNSISNTTNYQQTKILREYLTCEYNVRMANSVNPPNFTKDTLPGHRVKVPQQKNTYDCGLYILQYAEEFFKQPIRDFRVPINEISNWFDSMVIACKREEIAKLIQRLIYEHHQMIGTHPKIKLPNIPFPTTSNGKQCHSWLVANDDVEMIAEELT